MIEASIKWLPLDLYNPPANKKLLFCNAETNKWAADTAIYNKKEKGKTFWYLRDTPKLIATHFAEIGLPSEVKSWEALLETSYQNH